jgi:hypothetical protein
MMKNKRMKATATVLALGALMGGLTACQSDAKKVSENISTAADNFEAQRKIVGVNTRTDKYLFYVEGRCSIERDNGWLVVICKHGENDFRKHLVSQSTDVALVVTQEAGMDASVYHTRIIVKPENLLPSLELSTGKQ